jgi:hypothetical protein
MPASSNSAGRSRSSSCCATTWPRRASTRRLPLPAARISDWAGTHGSGSDVVFGAADRPSMRGRQVRRRATSWGGSSGAPGPMPSRCRPSRPAARDLRIGRAALGRSWSSRSLLNRARRQWRHARACGRGSDAPTATTSGAGYVVEPFVLSRHGEGAPRAIDEPTPTQVAKHSHCLISPYYGSGSGETLRSGEDPLPTATAKARFGMVVPITHNDGANRARDVDVDDPLPTLTTANRGELAFIAAQFGERPARRRACTTSASRRRRSAPAGHVNPGRARRRSTTSCSGCSSRTSSPPRWASTAATLRIRRHQDREDQADRQRRTQEAALQTLKAAAARQDIPLLDRRHKDFSIK